MRFGGKFIPNIVDDWMKSLMHLYSDILLRH